MSEKCYLIEPAECRSIGLYAARSVITSINHADADSVSPVIKMLDHSGTDTVIQIRHEACLDDAMRFECQFVRSEGYGVLTEWIKAGYRKPRRTDSLYLNSEELGYVMWLAAAYATGRTDTAVNDVCAFLIKHAGHLTPVATKWFCAAIRRSLTPEGIKWTYSPAGLSADDERVIRVVSQWKRALHALESALEERDTAESVSRAWKEEI